MFILKITLLHLVVHNSWGCLHATSRSCKKWIRSITRRDITPRRNIKPARLCYNVAWSTCASALEDLATYVASCASRRFKHPARLRAHASTADRTEMLDQTWATEAPGGCSWPCWKSTEFPRRHCIFFCDLYLGNPREFVESNCVLITVSFLSTKSSNCPGNTWVNRIVKPMRVIHCKDYGGMDHSGF